MRLLSIPLLLALLFGCSPGQKTVENAVKENLPRPRYVEFEDFQRYQNQTVCGRYMSSDHMGDLHGFRPFIYTPEFVDVSPAKTDFYIFCSNEQALRLNEKRGFAIAQDDIPAYTKIRDDFLVLNKAISSHIKIYKALPANLEELVEKAPDSELDIAPEALKAATVDPWGETYRYKEEGWGGVALDYKMCVHRADKEQDDTQRDPDICRPDLKYFPILLNQ